MTTQLKEAQLDIQSWMRAALAAALAATVLPLAGIGTAAHAAAHNGLPDGTRKQKSLVIGVDGATFAKFSAVDMPAIKGLMAQGMTAKSNLYAASMAPTMSGPGWGTIATGVWPDKHLVKDNSFSGNNFATYPSYQARLETANPAVSTLVVGTWGPITSNVFTKADVRIVGSSDSDTTAKAVNYLSYGNPDSTFVHLDDVDHAGHSYGAASPEYRAELKAADVRVGRMVQAVTSRPTYANEDWLIIVTADHGHTDAGGHGGNTAQERQTFVIAKGAGYRAGSHRYDIKVVDIAPWVLAHEGVAAPTTWGLDGKAVPNLAPDAFDSRRSSLLTRVDETSISTSIKGWTAAAPSGWQVDNTRMPSGGVTEWRGWSFATDEFWTATDPGQGRETNVRARDVFAVADSDEWDDKAHGAGQFDSTLISPRYAVPSDGTITLYYATNYKIDGPQTGDVHVSWNGGRPSS